MHCSVGPSFTCGHAAVCVQSNTLDNICMLNLLSSYLDILQCGIYFQLYFWQFFEMIVAHMFELSGKDDVHAA